LKRRSCGARPEEHMKKAITFNLTGVSPSKFYSSFQRPVSLYYLWNPYLLKRRFGGARLE
jgi:hypothetical protein